MKRILTLFALALLPLLAGAQESQADFLRRYNNLVERVGPSGLGVETLLNKWEAAYPEDPQQMVARFSFCFDRCRTSHVEVMSVDKYLGNPPLLPLTDSLGKKQNYFEVYDYDDDLFAEANVAIGKAISVRAWRLDYRFAKIDALIAYEKDKPEMALQELCALVDKNYKENPAWEYEGLESVSPDQFKAFMQDYCVALFRLGSDASAEAFKTLSERMLLYCNDDPLFLDNLGSYHLVKKEYKKALQYFDKVLKKHPGDMTALKNCLLLARTTKDKKLEKKYLQLMARHGETEQDRAGAAARLEAYK